MGRGRTMKCESRVMYVSMPPGITPEFTGGNIKNGTLTGADVKGGGTVDGTLTTGDVKNRSLLKGDFKAGQLPAGPHGARGPAGADGTARGYARLSMQGNLVPSQSKGVLGVRHAVIPNSGDQWVPFGAYCFNLLFTLRTLSQTRSRIRTTRGLDLPSSTPPAQTSEGPSSRIATVPRSSARPAIRMRRW